LLPPAHFRQKKWKRQKREHTKRRRRTPRLNQFSQPQKEGGSVHHDSLVFLGEGGFGQEWTSASRTKRKEFFGRVNKTTTKGRKNRGVRQSLTPEGHWDKIRRRIGGGKGHDALGETTPLHCALDSSRSSNNLVGRVEKPTVLLLSTKRVAATANYWIARSWVLREGGR